MEQELKVGDKVLNVGYLDFIGNKSKWLKINMNPFQEISGVGQCVPWNEVKTCFATQHSDVKYLANIPMHRNKIFDVKTGFDMDRQLERLLPVSTHKEEIKELVKKSVAETIEKGNSYRERRIADAEREILKLRQEMEEHIEFCNECGDYLISECEKD